MNSNHHPGQDDKSLPGDLDKLAQAYRRAGGDEPPRLLDQAVLGSAHRAVEKKPRRLQFGWLHGLTTTAVVVLAIAIYHFQQPPARPLQRDATPPETEPLRQAAPRDAFYRVRAPIARDELSTSRDKAAAVPVDDAKRNGEQPVPAPAVSAPAGTALAEPATNSAPAAEAVSQNAREEADSVAGAAGTTEAEAEPAATGGKASLKKDTDAEVRIKAILALKRAGDKTWRGALEEFTRTHPDYPLPEELKH